MKLVVGMQLGNQANNALAVDHMKYVVDVQLATSETTYLYPMHQNIAIFH